MARKRKKLGIEILSEVVDLDSNSELKQEQFNEVHEEQERLTWASF